MSSSSIQAPPDPFISFQYVSDDKPFLKIFCNKPIGKKKELYIFYEDEIHPEKRNMTIWIFDEPMDDFIEYIKMIVNRINYSQKNVQKNVQQIMLGSNIGYPETTFELNDEKGIFEACKELLKYISKIEVAKLGLMLK